MMRGARWCQRWWHVTPLAVCWVTCLAALLQGTPESAWAAADKAPVALQWAVERNAFAPEVTGTRALASFTLKASDRALPASGWALYFTCIGEMVLGATVDELATIEQVKGTLYRLRPGARFSGVPAGQSRTIRFFHPDLMFRLDKAPQGPYLVFDDEPAKALALVQYDIEPLTRPEQLSQGPGQPPITVTPAEIFKRNSNIFDVAPKAWPPVFPTPQKWHMGSGTLAWKMMPLIQAPSALRREAAWVREVLQPYWPEGAAPSKVGPRSAAQRVPQATLRLSIGRQPHDRSPEAYTLRIDPLKGVAIVGASPAGVFRGIQSLRDLLPPQLPAGRAVELPLIEIADAPRFEYRGVLLDVARSFHPKDTVMRLIDLMARFKLNKLHLHLTDDEGWRLAIDGLPELTEVGARRGHGVLPLEHLPPAHGSGPHVDTLPGSGYYSADDYIEILRHAAARHVEVIPEIEMPGHARAAVRAMEVRERRLQAAGRKEALDFRLADPQDRSVYRSPQLHTDHLMDPGLDSTYRFIDHVVAQVVRLHRRAGVPLRTLHVGADELPAGAWAQSPSGQAAIAKHRLAGLPGLWNHFYDRVHTILKRHRVEAAGWEELGARRQQADGKGPLVPNEHFKGRGFTLFVWNNLDDNEDLAYRLANAGYRSVLAPATALYFDMAHHRDPSEPGVNWAAVLDLDTVFNYVPFDALRTAPGQPGTPAGKTALSETGRRHIAGLEATLFSEILHTRDRLDYMLMPRMLGLAERAWAADPAWARERDPLKAQALHTQAWSLFAHQLGSQVLPRLTREMPSLHWRIPSPGLQREGDAVRVNLQLPGLEVRYTTDGSEPTLASELVHGPIRTPLTVRAAAFAPDGRRSAVATLGDR